MKTRIIVDTIAALSMGFLLPADSLLYAVEIKKTFAFNKLTLYATENRNKSGEGEFLKKISLIVKNNKNTVSKWEGYAEAYSQDHCGLFYPTKQPVNYLFLLQVQSLDDSLLLINSEGTIDAIENPTIGFITKNSDYMVFQRVNSRDCNSISVYSIKKGKSVFTIEDMDSKILLCDFSYDLFEQPSGTIIGRIESLSPEQAFDSQKSEKLYHQLNYIEIDIKKRSVRHIDNIKDRAYHYTEMMQEPIHFYNLQWIPL